eukprot:1146815_1
MFRMLEIQFEFEFVPDGGRPRMLPGELDGEDDLLADEGAGQAGEVGAQEEDGRARTGRAGGGGDLNPAEPVLLVVRHDDADHSAAIPRNGVDVHGVVVFLVDRWEGVEQDRLARVGKEVRRPDVPRVEEHLRRRIPRGGRLRQRSPGRRLDFRVHRNEPVVAGGVEPADPTSAELDMMTCIAAHIAPIPLEIIRKCAQLTLPRFKLFWIIHFSSVD